MLQTDISDLKFNLQNGRDDHHGKVELIEKMEGKMREQLFGIKIGVDLENCSVEFSSDPVGQLTNSTHTDYYVYEWFIKETGEIFYVGKRRRNRHNIYHERAYEAEGIRKTHVTDVKFVGRNLTEEQAIELESKEMTRILNETSDRLTNRFVPLITKRDNGYGRSLNTPKLEFEKAPCLYASEIENHYFYTQHRPFDQVKYDELKSVCFIDKSMEQDVLKIVYGGNYENYYAETIALLETNGHKILKSKYAKSVTAWIYSNDDYVSNYILAQEQAENKVGRKIPAYHLIDVWKFLRNTYGEVNTPPKLDAIINPKHNRVPLEGIRNADDWDKGFDEGHKYWEQGDEKRKNGNVEEAIILFDKARYHGYLAPALYDSYTLAYRKLKDFENEVAILDEGIARFQDKGSNINLTFIIKLKEQKNKATQKLRTSNVKD